MNRGFSFYAFAVLAWTLVACIAAQTFLAGLAVFTSPAHWSSHRSLVHWFEVVPLLMLVFAFTGRLANAAKWQSGALFALIFVQYATANAPGAGALHPVIALLMFYLAFRTARGAGSRPRGEANDEKAAAGRRLHPLLVIALSFLAGAFAGMLLSQLIGIIGYYALDFPEWLKLLRFLPLVTGIICAIAVPIGLRRRRM